MKSKIKVIAMSILYLIIIINCYLLFSKIVLKEELPSFFGLKNAVVLTGSMEPVFSAGDMLIYFERDEYEVGDIVIFGIDNVLVTHRIIDEKDGYFITKGDANNTEDLELLSPNSIKGEMIFVIPNIGHFINFLNTPLGLLILILLGVAVFEIPRLLENHKHKRRKYKREV